MARVRLPFLALLLTLTSACGRAAEERAMEARMQADRARKEAAQTVAALRDTVASDQAVLLGLSGRMLSELAALAGREVPADELQMRADRMLSDLSDAEASLRTSDAGLRFLVEARLRAAALLADARIDAGDAVDGIAAESLALAEQAQAAEPDNRERGALVADAHAGSARIALVRGDFDAAVAGFKLAIELLEAADKGRGTGTGTGRSSGGGEGDGRGQGKGKGRSKARSVAMKRHQSSLLQELAFAYREAGDFENECATIQRERHVIAKLCQMAYGSPGTGYQAARMGMSDLLDRLGDAAGRYGEPGLALLYEELALNILCEISDEAPEEPAFLVAIPPQAIEVVRAQVDQGELEKLRATVARTLDEDLSKLARLGANPADLAASEAHLAFHMGRGLAAAAAEAEDGAALMSEAATWFGRALERLEGLRSGAELPPDLANLEAATTAALAAVEADLG
ncbi:MAG: hypothetical protein AAF682_25215 [Planctomycetota bacterium]